MNYSIDDTRIYSPSKIKLPLVHCVPEWETLCKIIREGFKPFYCTEFLSNNDRNIVAAFPMISFSNVSVHEAIGRMKSYGTFGIALKKSWGEKNKLNPVLYLDRYSDLTDHILNSFDRLKNYSLDDLMQALEGRLIGDRHLLIKTLLDTFSYAKNYDGPLVRSGIMIDEQYSFGLEREWRLVLRKEGIKPFLFGKGMEHKSEANKAFDNVRIPFELEDIEGIVVETEWQEEEIQSLLISRFGRALSTNFITINTTRHINEDS